jgi:hypothetical protein
MAKLGINTGIVPDDGNGDSLLDGAIKINSNFNEIYSYFGDGTNLTFTGGGVSSQWVTTGAGIHTLSNVGIGTTNPRFKLEVGAVGASGTSLYVNGDARVTGILTVGSASITLNGATNIINVGTGITINGSTGIISATSIVLGGTTLTGAAVTSITAGSGISINQSTGNVTITATGGGGGSSQWTSTAAGIHTLSNVGIGTTNPTSAFTVKGNTSLETLSVSGVSTLSSNVSVGGTISVDGGVTLATNNVTIVGTSATEGEIKRIGGAPFFYDGSAWREFVLSSGTPVTVPADTEWDSVILRTTYDNNFVDEKFGVSPIVVGSGSTTVSSPRKIGTRSFRNDGTVGAGISYAYRSDYDFTGPWTIEFWIYHDSQVSGGTYQSLVSMFNSNDTSGEWTFGLHNNGINHFWYWSNENKVIPDALQVVSNATFDSIYLNKWVHYALVRESDSGSIHFYSNGFESSSTINNAIIDNNILDISGSGLHIGGNVSAAINGATWNSGISIDAFFDDLRITKDVRYTSVGIATTAVYTPPTTALPITGTLSSYVQPPGDKYGEIGLGTSPTWRGTSGVTVNQQSSGNYRVSFASTYTNSNDYFVLSQAMDQGFASYVGVARSTTHVDFAINKESDDTAVDTGSLSVQITNHD